MKSNAKKRGPVKRFSRSPESASSILEHLLDARHLSTRMKQSSVLKEWERIVGSRFAEHSEPEKISRGKILVVKVSGPIWAQELALHKDRILSDFRELEFGSVIEDIRFVVTGPRDLK